LERTDGAKTTQWKPSSQAAWSFGPALHNRPECGRCGEKVATSRCGHVTFLRIERTSHSLAAGLLSTLSSGRCVDIKRVVASGQRCVFVTPALLGGAIPGLQRAFLMLPTTAPTLLDHEYGKPWVPFVAECDIVIRGPSYQILWLRAS